MQCPNIVPRDELSWPEGGVTVHECNGYTYYNRQGEHHHPKGFCQERRKAGRVYDVFKCMTEADWRRCAHFSEDDILFRKF